MVLDKLKGILRSDAFEPSIEIFPEIDTALLARQLKPDASGRDRGKRNQPPAEAADLDGVERELVEEVSKLRSKGIKVFQDHASVYADRLGKAAEVKNEVMIVAGTTTGNFRELCQGSESAMQESMTRLKEAAQWKANFKRANRLVRPGIRLNSGGIKLVSVALALILLEAVLNSYLFAQRNELGLLGGIMVAILVSLANVGASTLAGFYSRFIWHLKLLPKIFGLLIILGWLALVLVFNFGIAHFRDSLVSLETADWNEAARLAVEKMIAAPHLIQSVESWLLVLIGLIISVSACLKGFYSDDPYPYFGTVERTLQKGRAHYVQEHQITLDQLRDQRDDSIEQLQQANDMVKSTFSEAMDALDGRSTLDIHLKQFIERCDAVVEQLLQRYRDANRDARTEPAPEYFNRVFSFEPFLPVVHARDKRPEAEQARSDISRIVSDAILEINSSYNSAVDSFKTAKDIEEQAEGAEAQGRRS